MSKRQIFILCVMALIMVGAAFMLGNWSEQINPDGIAPHPVADGEAELQADAPRDAFSFGFSMGLLACALAYCCMAFGLVISARSKGRAISRFTYWVAGFAGLGFVLSYLIDDYFY